MCFDTSVSENKIINIAWVKLLFCVFLLANVRRDRWTLMLILTRKQQSSSLLLSWAGGVRKKRALLPEILWWWLNSCTLIFMIGWIWQFKLYVCTTHMQLRLGPVLEYNVLVGLRLSSDRSTRPDPYCRCVCLRARKKAGCSIAPNAFWPPTPGPAACPLPRGSSLLDL